MSPFYSKYSETNVEISKDNLIEVFKEHANEFEPLNRLASLICDTPVSLVNILDENFQYTVAGYGDWKPEIKPKSHTACQFTVEKDEILVINDTLEDERASNIKEVTEDASIRFYAGVPIKTEGGYRFGAFCVCDSEPKELHQEQKQALKDLAKEVEFRLKLVRQKKGLEFRNRKLKEASAFLKNSADILWLVESGDFNIVKSNGALSVIGVEDEKLIGSSLLSHINDVDIKKQIRNWLCEKYDDNKLVIPVQIKNSSEPKKWLNLTFSHYDGKLIVTGRDITKEHLAEEKLKESLEEKEVLLAEIHHRVKNNLAVVSSLIKLERFESENKEAQKILLYSESRISTMAKIHELLYETKDFMNVDVREYLLSLADYLKESYALENRNITIELAVGGLRMNVNQCLPMGLLINEVTTNALKHAFDNQDSGSILIQVIEKDDSEIECTISDDGKGMEIKRTNLDENGGLGFTLIKTLKKQLDAELEITSKGGTTFILTFKKNNKKGSVTNLQLN